MTPLSTVEMADPMLESASSLVPMNGASLFDLPALPYAFDALEPYMTARTMGFHFSKHHRTYIENLNNLLAGSPRLGEPLEKIIVASASNPEQVPLFNNAAQAWNHAFFWHSITPHGGGPLPERLAQLILNTYTTREEFNIAFVAAALAQFGSGWVWLVQEDDAVQIVKTSNADTPLAHRKHVLLTCDVWEHAYYLDYQYRRKDFVLAFLDHLANWQFAESRIIGV